MTCFMSLQQYTRKKEKLTQKQLAGKLNITFQAVSRWEKGISVPSLDVLDDLSRIFNVSIDEGYISKMVNIF